MSLKINTQKCKRIVILSWVLLLLVSVGVMPALAAEYLNGTAYNFDQTLTLDKNLLGSVITFDVTTEFSVRGTSRIYSRIWIENEGTDADANSQWVLMYGNTRVYVWQTGSVVLGYWVDEAFTELRFAEEVTDSALVDFLDNNGVVDTSASIEGPAIDPGDLVPDEIAGTYFQKLVDVINIFWTSPVILSYVGILASLMIVSFVIFGSKR